ncbi:MAG TPA: LysM peptidoglycan-binding domain-containing protein [Anaerolineales bacterium]|nr:LysM peptidoglycan-binding domain-containing protein [Anaerolineales bacterium]
MMRKRPLFPYLRILLALACLAGSGLACNFPAATPEISSQQLAQTLAASGGGQVPGLPTPEPGASLPAPSAEAGAPPAASETQIPPSPLPLVTLPPATPYWLATPTPGDPGAAYTYYTQPGDTLQGLAGRFDVTVDQISPYQAGQANGYLPGNQQLTIPNTYGMVSPSTPLLPDSEMVYSPTSLDFDVAGYVMQAGGYLSTYQGKVYNETVSGAAIVQRVATELSVNPRLLLALLEYRSGWVFNQDVTERSMVYPLGFEIPDRQGLYEEMMIAATQLNLAYYGWRGGTFGGLKFAGGGTLHPNPTLNAGSVAVQHLFALLYSQADWQPAIYGAQNFLERYAQLFGDPWGRAAAAGPLLPTGLAQPVLELPFLPGEYWSLTAGPHFAWNAGTPRGALDFSPITGGAACAVSPAWTTAASPGLVVRSAYNAVALDLDGDGREQTGWVIVYMHLADYERIGSGVWVALDEPLGHPSCEGGRATGKHVHIARKYNGEWLAADGPVPFILSGWQAFAGEGNYRGTLEKDGQVVSSDSSGQQGSTIQR